ncbi:MAG: ferrochelatase [Chloroflexota bacterium]
MQANYDALLIVSFGGPEDMDEVLPFLENVLRGKNVPHERMLHVARHYELFGGVSPINAQNRAMIAALEQELCAHEMKLPIYWGNRNWQPYLADTLRQMRADGIQHALAFFTSAYSSYSGCRQYREDIQRAQAEVGIGAPQVDKLRVFYNHPGFIAANVERVCAAFEQIPPERRDKTTLIFTAHSIPLSMAEHSDYVAQLEETSRLVAEGAGHADWQLAYQSRSGSPRQPWLEPDIKVALRDLHASGTRDVVVMPIGFISDHMEVLYDLDTEARQLSSELGLNMIRAATAGTHPAFVAMIRELIVERMNGGEKRALGLVAADHDSCPADCCLAG